MVLAGAVAAFGCAAGDFSIADYGAKADGSKCTAAIAKAVEACAAAGGGRVVVPKGEWTTGAIRLMSNVELHLEEGATVLFSDRLEDHLPAVRNTYEGTECWVHSSHIYAFGETNVAVTGKGVLKTLKPSWSWEYWKVHKGDPDFRQLAEACKTLRAWGQDGVPVEKRQFWKIAGPRARMQFIHFERCQGVRLEDFRIDGSPMWTVHLYRCADVVARGLDIMARGLNTDGFDIEMTRDVLIEDCTLDQQDDGFTIKAGKDAAGRVVGVPTENVTIRNCHVKAAHGILVIGSEVSAGVRNVRLSNVTGDVVINGCYLKTNPYRGGFIEDVWFENVVCSNVQRNAFAIETDVNYGQLPLPGTEECLTRIRGVHVRNVDVGKASRVMKLTGDARLPIEDVTVDNLRVGYVRKPETNLIENVVGLVVDGRPMARARPGRTVRDLGGNGWTCDGLPVKVPHTWNAIDGSDGFPDGKMKVDCGSSVMSDSYLRKRGVYRRALPAQTPGKRQFLRFDGASMKAEVKVNGKAVGGHKGAFTAFTLEITGAMKADGNALEVAVDNRIDETINPINADFNMCGGLYRTVKLIETDPVCIDPTWYGTDGVVLRPDPATGTVRAEVKVLGGKDFVREYRIPNWRLWSPEEPNLYEIEIALDADGSHDSIRRQVGFRTAEFRDGRFYLNGRKLKVYGVNRHEDYEGKGWALEPGDDELDARWMKAMGATAVRLAHGAHGQGMLDQTDRLGVMAYVAIPFVNELRDTPEYRANARQETLETVAQFRNHPSVIWWDLYNEIYNSPRKIPEGFQEEFLEEMRDLVRKADPDHILMATTSIPEKKRLNAIPEMLSFNTYPHWYGDKDIGYYIDRVLELNGRKSIALGEYGAGGSVYHHTNPVRPSKPISMFHSEEYQTEIHLRDWREIARRNEVWGSFIWNMFDFGADTRKEGDRLGINDKGMVTRDRALAKDAFFLYKANWNPEPMLYLTGKRAKTADADKVMVRGFSNLGKPVELFVNSEKVGELVPDEVRSVTWNDVPLKAGENEVELRCGAFVEKAVWKR